jgi:hypothetical protein
VVVVSGRRLRLRRAGLAAVAALALLLALPLAAGGAPAQDGGGSTQSGTQAIDDLIGCMQGSRHLLVLFLIDGSASLKQTDPQDLRVDAAQSALESLATLAESRSGGARVEVAMATFANEYRPVEDWQDVRPDTAGDLKDALDRFRAFKDGTDTDFVNALSTGREVLADRAAATATAAADTPCRAILLFTDGSYDLAPRTTKAMQDELGVTKAYAPGIRLTTEAAVRQAEDAGRKALCEAGGVASTLRNDDVTLLTVALAKGKATKAQLPLIGATVGTYRGFECGSDKPAQGAYFPASDIDLLITQFDEVGTRLAGGTPVLPDGQKVAVCGGGGCEGGRGEQEFSLDSSLRAVHILALPPAAGATVRVVGPSGASADVTGPGSEELGSATIVTRAVAGRGLALDIDRPAEVTDWDGRWRVSILDPSGKQEGKQARLQVFVYSDIGVAFTTQDLVFERGVRTSLGAEVVVPKGTKVGDAVSAATARVRIRDEVTGKEEVVALQGPATGPFVGAYTTPAGTTANAAEVTIELQATTKGGAKVVTQSPPQEVLVRRPGGAAQFLPPSLRMDALTGKGSTGADLILAGGDAPSCVWFGPAKATDTPEGVGTVELTDDGDALPGEGDCVQVPAHQQVTVRITADPSGKGSGTVRGTLTVFERTKGGAKPTTTLIPYRFDLAEGVDEARRLLLAVLLVAAGLALPLGLLVLINAATARFQTLDVIRGASVPIHVADKRISRLDGGRLRPFSLRASDFASLQGTGSHRRFAFGGILFWARASRNPFGATVAMAAPEGGAEKLRNNEGSRVELDPTLAGSWVFLLDADKTRAANKGEAVGQLIAFVSEGDAEGQVRAMVPDVEDRLPAVASNLAGLVRQVKRRAKPARAPKPAKEAKPAKEPKGAKAAKAAKAKERVVEVPTAEPEPPAEAAAGLRRGPKRDTRRTFPVTGIDPTLPAPAGEPEAEPAEAEPEVEPTEAEAPPAEEPGPAAPAGFTGGPAAGAVPSGTSSAPGDDVDDADVPPPSAPLGFGGPASAPPPDQGED